MRKAEYSELRREVRFQTEVKLISQLAWQLVEKPEAGTFYWLINILVLGPRLAVLRPSSWIYTQRSLVGSEDYLQF